MYHISIYFDEDTNQKIRNHINQIEKVTGNVHMTEGNIPPHITLSVFNISDEKIAKKVLEMVAKRLGKCELDWVSVGSFLPYVLYIAPVLNQQLHHMSMTVYEELKKLENVEISKYYRPFQWLPHTTIGKKLTKEQMGKAFDVMQKQFGPFKGTVTSIGLAKTNPYKNIAIVDLD